MNVVRKELRGYLRVWRGFARFLSMKWVLRGCGEGLERVWALYESYTEKVEGRRG